MPQAPEGPRKRKVVKKKSVGDAISKAGKGKKVDFGPAPKKGVFKPVPKAKVKPGSADAGVGKKSRGTVKKKNPLRGTAIQTQGPNIGNNNDAKLPRVFSKQVNLDREAAKAAAPALVALNQFNRIPSAQVTGVRAGIRAVKKGENPVSVAAKTVKGEIKGFRKNNTEWSEFLGKDVGLPRGAAAAGGFALNVGLDPTTYATGGSAPAARVAAKAAAKGVEKKVVKKGLDRVAVKQAETAATRAALKKQKRQAARVKAISDTPENAAIAGQRKQLAELEAKGRGSSKKAENIRKNLARSGKKNESRVARASAPVKPAAVSKRDAKTIRRRRTAEWGRTAERVAEPRVAGKKGVTTHFGVGRARVKVTHGRRAFGTDRSREGLRRTVQQVAPRVRTDPGVTARAHEGALAANRSRRAGQNVAAHDAQATANALTRVFPKMSDDEARQWIRAYEANDPSLAPAGFVKGEGRRAKLVGAREVRLATERGRKAVLRSGQQVGDVAKIRLPNTAATKAELAAARKAEREADKAVRHAQRNVGKAQVRLARSSTKASTRVTAKDRALLKAALPADHPVIVAMGGMAKASARLRASGPALRNRVRDANKVLYKPDERVGAIPERVAAKKAYAAAKANYEKELDKALREADRLYGSGQRDGLALLSRHGEGNLIERVSDDAADLFGYRAEVKGAKRKAHDAKRVVREKRARHEREKAKARRVRPSDERDVARTYYPHDLPADEAAREGRFAGMLPASGDTSHLKSRKDPRRLDVKNREIRAKAAAAEAKGLDPERVPFSENPVLDVANYELAQKRTAAAARAQTKLADQGTAVRFGTVRGGKARKFSPDEFRARHGVDRNHRVYFLGSRNGRYGLHEVDDAAVDAMAKAGRGAENGRYVVLDRRTVKTALDGPSGVPNDIPVVSAYDKLSGGFKKLAISTPMYHAINHFGDTWIMYTKLPAKQIPVYQTKAVAVLRYLQAQEAARMGSGKVFKGVKELGEREIMVGGERMTVAQFAREITGEGAARQGFYARLEDVQHFAEKGVKPNQSAGKPFRAWGRTLRSREDMNRIGTYWYLRDQGVASEKAADDMLEALIDYGQLSAAERNIFRRAALFYTFPARQIPYQTKAIGRTPGKFANYEKLRVAVGYGFNVDRDSLSDEAYYKQAGLGIPLRTSKGPLGIPVPDPNGEVRYLGVNLPINVLNLTMPFGVNAHPSLSLKDGPVGNAAQFAGSMLNPLLKAPIELTANYNLFYRAPIQSETSPSTPAPSWAVALGKANPTLLKELGLVEKEDKVTGKMVWQWNKIPNYVVSQASPGPVRMLSGIGKSSNPRGLTKTDEWVRFGTGLRFDRSDKPGQAITLLFGMHDRLSKREGVLNKSKQEGGPEWRAIKSGKVEIGAHILAESYARGDVKLLDPENLLPRALKDRRPTPEQIDFVLRKARFTARAKRMPTSGSAAPSVPSLPSVPSIP